ncbi:MAG: aquaporin Z [Prevotellaceae bacterium]|jgi:aquaporin Z|nr:aquaporin Z [Prevotellaceae bacterium]
MTKKLAAEFFGTFWLVMGGCGTAVLAGSYVGVLGIALAFGLTVLTMAFAIGHISGCHLNPAVTLGLWAGGKFDSKEIVSYISAQLLGATVAATILFFIMNGKVGDFAANGFGEASPGGYGLVPALLMEIVMTFMFLFIILGAIDERAPKGFAPLAIGLGLTLIHLISIPVTNTSVNPARSISQALFAQDGGVAIQQLWLFVVAPIFGAILAGMLYKWLKK